MKNKKNKKNCKIIFSFIILLFIFSLFLFRSFNLEPDYFWHMKAGKLFFENGFIYNDTFSWFMKGHYWVSHEWLFEVIIYVLKLLFGKFHILIYVVLCLFSLYLIIFILNKDKMFKNLPFTLFWLFCSSILTFHCSCRPQLFSFNFLALTVYFCYDLYLNEDSKKIYLLPFISILWANIHGGSCNLSYIFPIIFVLFTLTSFSFNKIENKKTTFKQRKKFLCISFLCMICILFNPHGIKMLFYPYVNLNDSLMLSSISEWQPSVISNNSHLPYFILCFIILLIFIFSKKKIVFLDLILFFISLFLGLKSIRFWGYTYIIMSFIIPNYIGKRKIEKGTCVSILCLSIFLFSVFLFNFNKIEINARVLDSKLINILKSENVKRLYNNYDYGGELVYNDIKVFIDGRADLYSKYNLKDYFVISSMGSGFEKLIDKYEFDYFLIDKDFPLNKYLNNQDFEILYDKNNIILYKAK